MSAARDYGCLLHGIRDCRECRTASVDAAYAQRLANPRHLRPRAMPNGSLKWEEVPECACEDRRGPKGGVCGNCGFAIPVL